ncbi:polysaccharide deacetylase family protein [Paenibacillus sp. UNC451MF]|uniref:polysaccharide deacetylase family protein n=1 Tax=Paenibacillus sp. UNC451MF TaxID=1449063 RepID=UPI00048F53E7|nr:polysaccharide deacetylase family protein [Paenibacillus sp. UNC451MF]
MHSKSLMHICNNFIRRSVLVSLFFLVILQLVPVTALADSPVPEDNKVLVIYSTQSGSINDSVRLLDLLLGQFARSIKFQDDESVTSSDLKDVTHLVYYGGTKKKLPAEVIQLVTQFKGPALVAGANIEQFRSRFSFMTIRERVYINQVSKADPSTDEPIYQFLDSTYPITQVELNQGKALFEGWRGDASFPLFAQYENSAYYAADNLDVPFNRYLSRGLADFFGSQLTAGHTAYIRLEDVHPMSDPKLLKQTGDYLADKGIPFMIALIPIYTNNQTNQQLHLSDSPAIVEVLRHLQERGASILLHGYTHQYRSSETGEGFEFWDVLNNTPIWGPSDQETKVRKRHEFSSKEEYDRYMQQLQAFEKQYIDSRIVSGIQELTDLGLYPLGFEAPHYVMSQTGYEIVSHYFNYVLGQTQVSNSDWEHMGESPYRSTPSFLHGMTLLPETIGYYDDVSSTPETDLDQKIAGMQFIDGGMMGMFYHPYLGLEKLKTFISHVERVPNIKWLDLKKMNASVKAPDITILTDSQGQIQYTNTAPRSEAKQVVKTLKQLGGVQLILWGVAILVAIMVLMFFLYTISMRMNLRKQLFEERNISG